MSCIIVFPALGLFSSCFSSRCCFWQIRLPVNRELGFYQSLMNYREISNGIEWQWIKSELTCRTPAVKPLCTFCSLSVWACNFGVMPLINLCRDTVPRPQGWTLGSTNSCRTRPCPGFFPQIWDSFALQLVQNCCYLLYESLVAFCQWGAQAHPAHKLLHRLCNDFLECTLAFSLCTSPQDLHCGF